MYTIFQPTRYTTIRTSNLPLDFRLHTAFWLFLELRDQNSSKDFRRPTRPTRPRFYIAGFL